MTLSEAADYFKMPLGTLRWLVSAGHLRSLNGKRPHVVNPWDVQDWIDTDKRRTRRVARHLTRSSVRSARLDESVGEHSPDDQHRHGDACPGGCDDRG